MVSAEELSGLLASLYAAPLEPQSWQAFFDRLCAATNVASGYMISLNSAGEGTILAGGGFNFQPEIFRRYNEYYGANDPFAKGAMKQRPSGIVEGDTLISHADLVRSELYNEILTKYQMAHLTLMCCGASSRTFLPLWSTPQDGRMDEASTHLLQTLIPHVEIALRLHAQIESHNLVKDFSELTLDRISTGAFLVSANGAVQHMNARATAYLKEGGALTVLRGKLVAHTSQHTARLHQLVRAAALDSSALPHAPGGAMRLLRPKTGTWLHITVVPVPQRNSIPVRQPHALVFVSDPATPVASRAVFMRQLYSLTPAESRVADLLMQGMDIREASERLHITVETARFHTKRVLQKTGARRQSELIRLMLSLPSSR